MKKRIVLVVMFFFIGVVTAQTISIDRSITKFPLPAIIKSFEEQHQFNFSYDADAVKDILIEVASNTLSITAFIEILDTQTGYQITMAGDTDFLIVKKDTKTTICGVVIDAASGFELSNTEIIMNATIKAITDRNGNFEFSVDTSKKDTIQIAFLGYKTQKKTVADFNPKQCDTIRLVEEIQQLNSVVLKDYLTTGVQKNADGSVLFSTKKLKILPGLVEPDVFTGLQSLPGISSPTEDAAALYIRGGTPDQNLVLFDGIKMYQTGHFFDQISGFNPYIIGETNVYRGGTSVRYGDRLSGVIDISTDDQILDSLVVGGGINLTHGDVFIKSPITKNSGFLVSLRRSTIDLYDNIVTENLIEKVFQNTRGITDDTAQTIVDIRKNEDKRLFTDVNFKYLWNINKKNVLKLSGIFLENRLNNIRLDTSDPNFESSIFNDALKTRNLGSSLQWKKTGDSGSIQNTIIYISYYDQRYKVTRDVETDTSILTSDNIINDFGAEYTLEIPLSDQNGLHLGYQMVRNKTSYFVDSRTPDPNDDINTFADRIDGKGTNYTLFSEYRHGTTKTYYSLGQRTSYLSNIQKLFIEPRVYISTEVLNNFRITSSIELKNQQLSRYAFNNKFNAATPALPISDNTWLLSNSTYNSETNFDTTNDRVILPVLKSTQFTLGVLWKHRGWNFDMEGYYKKIRDIGTTSDIIFNLAALELEDEFGDDESIFNPIGTEDRIGLDFLAKKTFHNYRFWFGYSLSSSSVKFPNIQRTSFPNLWDQRHTLNISQTLKVKNFEFALGWRYASGTPFTNLIPDQDDALEVMIDPSGINGNRFTDYHRLDFSIVYRFLSSKNGISMIVGSSIRNLYNRKNIINQGYATVNDPEFGLPKLIAFQNESLALTPDFVFRITF